MTRTWNTHSIDTGEAAPIKARMRHTPLGFQGEEQKHLENLLKTKVIKPSISDWASAPVLIRKKDGTVRYCIDFRPLNGKTDNVWCSTLDWYSGYYQLLLNPKDCHKTAFITKFGLFAFLCMPFDLCNAPSTFQQVVQFIFSGMLWKEVLAYLDDIFVLGKSFKGHLLNIRKALLRLKKYNLKLKPQKCILFQTEVTFLGRLFGQNGISIDPGKIEPVKKWPVPRNIQELQSFLGFVNYHRDHIKDFAVMTESLYDLTWKKKNKSPTEWTDEHDKAFENVKDILINAPVLAFPRPDDTFILDTDASNSAIGAVLSQVQFGEEKVICYGSFSLTPAHRKYCTTRKELLAVVRFAEQYKHYLLGGHFYVRTDHNSLAWLMRFKNIEG